MHSELVICNTNNLPQLDWRRSERHLYQQHNTIQETTLSFGLPPRELGSKLNCDICGRVITGQAFKVQVEGAKMLVCSSCQSLGKPYSEEPGPQLPAVRDRSFLTRKRTTELPREMSQFDLVEDLAERVRKYRMKLALTQEELAKRVKERLSVIQKIETGRIAPDIRLCRALEHELKVKLLVPHTETADVPKSAAPSEVTLGDIVRVKDKLEKSNT